LTSTWSGKLSRWQQSQHKNTSRQNRQNDQRERPILVMCTTGEKGKGRKKVRREGRGGKKINHNHRWPEKKEGAFRLILKDGKQAHTMKRNTSLNHCQW